MSQAGYRWENRAIAAWTRNEPIPQQEADAEVSKACMGQARQALGLEAEKDREFLQQSSDKMVTALGEAAKKPAPSATATATSTGTAKSDTPALTASNAPPKAG